MTESWYEIQLDDPSGGAIAEVCDKIAASGLQVDSLHFFRYEPWAKAVIRVNTSASLHALAALVDPAVTLPWDGTVTPDSIQACSEVYGEATEAVLELFAAASKVALLFDRIGEREPCWTYRKMVHCLLNTCGFDVPDEVQFAGMFLGNRLKFMVKDAVEEALKK